MQGQEKYQDGIGYFDVKMKIMKNDEQRMKPFIRLGVNSAGYLFRCLLPVICILSGCATLPLNVDNHPSVALTDTADTAIGQRVAQRVSEAGEATDYSGVTMLADGLDAFAARMALAGKAQRTIDAQYYMVHADLTGALFSHQLLEAADRGVRVRLLIDDMDLEKRDESLSALDQHPNLEIRIFNPFSRKTLRLWQYLSRLGSVTRRMHNKSFTVDNQVTVVGGRNIGNEYFDADPEMAFGDLDMLAIGPVVREVSQSFDEYWNSSLAYPIDVLRPDLVGSKSIAGSRKKLEAHLQGADVQNYIKQLKENTLIDRVQSGAQRLDWGPARVFADSPEKIESYSTTADYSMVPQLSPFFQELKTELLIFSPYFVPGKGGTKNLAELSRKGVRVRILTNSLASTDVGIVHSGYMKYRRALLRSGVELYEVNKKVEKQTGKNRKEGMGASKASLHAKSFVLDRKKVFVGSLNLDPRSITENTEVGIMVNSEDVAEYMAEGFDEVMAKSAFRLELKKDEKGLEYIVWHGYENGEERTWGHEPHTSLWRRFLIGTLRFVPFVESQL